MDNHKLNRVPSWAGNKLSSFDGSVVTTFSLFPPAGHFVLISILIIPSKQSNILKLFIVYRNQNVSDEFVIIYRYLDGVFIFSTIILTSIPLVDAATGSARGNDGRVSGGI